MGEGLGMMRLLRFSLLIPLLVLTACSGGTDAPTLQLQVIDAFRGTIAARTAAAQATRPPLTRAALDTLEGSFLEVTRERTDQLAYLFVNATRRDDSPGRITVWRTEDDVTLATRNGVLIATRGLGGDVISSAVQVAGDAPGPSGGGERVQFIAARDNKQQRLALSCDLTDLGPDPVVIVEIRHPTRHLRERCTGGGGTIINDYWVDSQAGLVWQSRQWAGPVIGYLRLRRLTN
jgi:hypothetical protein